jgi:spoIIIJ-associated protein
MKDQVFEGPSVEEALSSAARALGIAVERVRYVVLDAGEKASRGLEARPARIAVLGDRTPQPTASAPAPASAPPAGAPAATTTSAAAAEIRELVRELARAAEVDLSAEVSIGEETVHVRIGGAGKDFLLEDDADVLESLEYLLQLMYRRALEPRRLVVECEGYRADRDRALREEALGLAEAVARDGQARRTRALNSYERRVVHTALTDHPQVRTFSVGEGADRRVTVALREAAPAAPPAGPPSGEGQL